MRTILYMAANFMLSSLLLFLLLSNTVNVAFAQSIQYIYDSQNQLLEVHYSDKIIHYTYDSAGNRIGQTVEILVAAPSITNLSPNSSTVGGNSFTLAVNGQNFTNNSIVQWNGSNRSTTFVNANQLTANILASDINSIGAVAVTVIDQTTSSVSNTQFFTVQPVAGCVPVSISNSLSVAANSTIGVPVPVGDLTNKGVNSYDFILTFNPNVVRPLASAPVDATGTLSSNFNITVNTATAGQLRVTAFGTSSLAGSGSLLNLNFEAIGANGTASDLTWAQFQLNEGDPCSTTTNGHLSVTGVSNSISGSITYGIVGSQGLKYVPNATLTAAGTPQITAASNLSGAYILSGLGSGSYTVTPTKTGDVNSISGFDASLVARKAAGLITLTPNQLIAADASNNGTISGFDASLIARTAAGVANNGIAGQWKFVPASRTYSSLTSNQTAQNYEAILMGEVSGNWVAPSSLSRLQYLSQTDQMLAAHSKEEAYELSHPLSILNAAKDTVKGNTLSDTDKVQSPQAGITVALPANATASNGTTVLIPITVGDTTGQGIFAFDFTVAFNQNVLQPASPAFDTTGTRAGAANFSITPNDSIPGKLNIIAFSSNQPLSGSGTLIYLRFNVIGTAGSPTTGMTSLSFDSFMFNEGVPAAMTSPGAFTVTGTTAASVSVGGRITATGGRGIAGARVSLTNAVGESRIVLSNPFGYYRFKDVAVGESYIITVTSKRRYQFAPQVLNLTGEINEINFTAEP